MDDRRCLRTRLAVMKLEDRMQPGSMLAIGSEGDAWAPTIDEPPTHGRVLISTEVTAFEVDWEDISTTSEAARIAVESVRLVYANHDLQQPACEDVNINRAFQSSGLTPQLLPPLRPMVRPPSNPDTRGDVNNPQPGVQVCPNFDADGWADQAFVTVSGRINSVSANTTSDENGDWTLEFLNVPVADDRRLTVNIQGEPQIVVANIDIVPC